MTTPEAEPRLRILHVVDNYPPVPGGMERAVQALARGQAERGHDVRVAALANPELPVDALDGQVRVRPVDTLGSSLPRRQLQLGSQLTAGLQYNV